MKKTDKKASKLLPEVLKTIVDQKKKKGSSPKHIAGCLRRRKNFRNVSKIQVRSAMKYGLKLGLVKHRRGKYSLIMDESNYAAYRGLGISVGECGKNRRRGKKGCSRRRGKRGRGGKRGKRGCILW